MAEESIEMSTPETAGPDNGSPRRKSTGIMKRKSSTPNYLRASTGSCHDFCKYGREHSFAVKARNPITKRMTPLSDKQKNKGYEVIAVKKETSAVKLKPSLDLKIHPSEQNIVNVVPAERKKALVVKLKPSPDLTHSTEPPEIIKREILLPSKKVEDSLKQNASDTKIMKDNETKMTSSPKRSPVPKSKPEMIRPSSSSNASVGSSGMRKTAIKPVKTTGTSKTAIKKVVAPPIDLVSRKICVSKVARKHSSLKPKLSLKDQQRTPKAEFNKPDTDMVEEKTVHTVEVEAEDNFLESIQNDGISQISPSPLKDECITWKDESKKQDKDQEKNLHAVEEDTENIISESVQSDDIIQILPSPLLQSPKSLFGRDSQIFSSRGDDAEEPEDTDGEDLEQDNDKDREKNLHTGEEETKNIISESVQSDDIIQILPFPILQSPESLSERDSQIFSSRGDDVEKSEDTDREDLEQDNDRDQEKNVHAVDEETGNIISESVQGDDIIQILPSPPKSFLERDSQIFSSRGDDVEEPEDTDGEDLEECKNTDGEDLGESEYTDREDVEGYEDTESEEDEFISEYDEFDASKGNQNSIPGKGGVIPSEDEDSELAKSKFRRGKIVDLQSEDKVPRRLKFRRGRVLGDDNDSKSYARRRTFKKRELDDANEAGLSSEKVVLRHQDMQQGKKDAQGLFNNVIEETASKLVESRKSKVKALVGAFETVISLQESKPSSTQAGS